MRVFHVPIKLKWIFEAHVQCCLLHFFKTELEWKHHVSLSRLPVLRYYKSLLITWVFDYLWNSSEVKGFVHYLNFFGWHSMDEVLFDRRNLRGQKRYSVEIYHWFHFENMSFKGIFDLRHWINLGSTSNVLPWKLFTKLWHYNYRHLVMYLQWLLK